MDKPYHYFVSSFAHFKRNENLVEAITSVHKQDLLSFGKYAPKSKAKKARDYEIQMVIYRIPGKVTDYPMDYSHIPQVEGREFIEKVMY
tara:strand:+ start:251 stop:517 length:267 start_codon:yes stop_codon:yes gene_type:complete